MALCPLTLCADEARPDVSENLRRTALLNTRVHHKITLGDVSQITRSDKDGIFLPEMLLPPNA
jgi:hypothetical protein